MLFPTITSFQVRPGLLTGFACRLLLLDVDDSDSTSQEPLVGFQQLSEISALFIELEEAEEKGQFVFLILSLQAFNMQANRHALKSSGFNSLFIIT